MRGPPAAPHCVERHFYRRAVLAFERGAELPDDAGLAHGLDIVASEQVAFEVQHLPRRVVREPQPSVAVDDEHPFDHAGQDGRHARAIGLELVQPARHLRRLAAGSRLDGRACAARRATVPTQCPASPAATATTRYRTAIEHRYGSTSL